MRGISTTVFLFASLLAIASASPAHNGRRHHDMRSVNRHQGLAAAGMSNKSSGVKRRADSRRCKASSSSFSSAPAETSTFVEDTPTSTYVPEETSTYTPPETTSSAEPETTSTPEPETTPTTTYEQPTTEATTEAPAATTAASDSGSSGSSSGEVHTGEATFYATGLGACGITNTDTDYIIAVSTTLFDTYPGYDGANPNNNPICGKQIKATYGGKSVTVTITDRCGACAYADLDFSPSAFDVLADQSLGRLTGMTWVYV